MLIYKQGSKVVHQGYIPANDSYNKPSWCRTSGWGAIWLQFIGKIKPPYRKCKLCFKKR